MQKGEAPISTAVLISDCDVHELLGAAGHLEMLDAQIASNSIHEQDFTLFRAFNNPNCVFFDIGANIGNSALSVHAVQPTWRVVSFEPNVALLPYLRKVAEVFRQSSTSFTLHNIGLADEAGELPFYVPRIEDWHVIGEASFSLQHFSDPVVSRRLSSYSSSGSWSLSRAKLPVVRFDDFGPVRDTLTRLDGSEGLFVKIDVEGLEERVLKGMMVFLKQYRPYLMIENSVSDGVPAYLSGLGFRMLVYDPARAKLVESVGRAGHLNLVYAHQDQIDRGYLDNLLVR